MADRVPLSEGITCCPQGVPSKHALRVFSSGVRRVTCGRRGIAHGMCADEGAIG